MHGLLLLPGLHAPKEADGARCGRHTRESGTVVVGQARGTAGVDVLVGRLGQHLALHEHTRVGLKVEVGRGVSKRAVGVGEHVRC